MTTRMLGRVGPTRLRSLAIAPALVGLVAGVAGATFALVAGEPAIEEAVAIEEASPSTRPTPPPDAVEVPATLVWRFRLASLGANLTLWSVLTLGLGWLVGEAVRQRGQRDPGPLLATASG